MLYLLPAVLLLVLFGYYLHRQLSVTASTAPFAAVCCIMLAGILFGCVNLLAAGRVILWLAFAGLGVYACIRYPAGLKAYLLAPGMLAFLAGAVFLSLYHLLYNSFYIQWDEFGHWGPFFKLIDMFGSYHQFTPVDMVHANYPQGIATVYYVLTLFMPDFTEASTFAVMGIVLAAASACVAGHINWKNPVVAAGCVLVLPLFFWLFPYAEPYITVYMDAMLGACFGAALLVTLYAVQAEWPLEGGASWKRAVPPALAVAALTQVKEMGLVLGLVCIAFYLVCLWAQVAQSPVEEKQGRGKKRGRWLAVPARPVFWQHAAVIIVGSLSFKIIWAIFLQATGSAGGQFSLGGNGSFFQRAFAAAAGQDMVFSTTLERFFINLRVTPVVYNGYGTSLIALGLLGAAGIVLGVLLWRRACRGAAIMLFGMPVFFVAYLFSIFYVYITMMNDAEAMVNNSFQRYISSFLIAWVMLFVAIFIQYCGDLLPLPFLKKQPGLLPALCCLCIVALLANISLKRDVLNRDGERLREGLKDFARVSGQIARSVLAEERIWVIAQGSDILYTYMFHYTMMPANVALGLPYTVGYEAGEAGGQLADLPARAREEGVTYILVYLVDPVLEEKYGGLFSDGLASVKESALPSLYRVVQDVDGGTCFELHLATVLP